MRRQRDRRRGGGVGATHAFRSEAIDARRVREAEAVAPEPVCPERVNRDDEEIPLLTRPAPDGGREGEEDPGEDDRTRQGVFAVPDLPAFAL